ncbi:MAG: hypothetical protein EB060_01490 [Proteobacteria bacterium]|nr:hypothetical protein [Pseudomonadota bacterium]
MTSINNNVAALGAQSNLRAANSKLGRSIDALSSGNRIIRASDDVAGLSIGSILRTNVNTLKTALANAGQANTVLQIADGALARISEILTRQKALAASANSGSLTNVERGFLNQEFQSNTNEINRIVKDTKFNSLTLLDGSIFDQVAVQTNTGDPLGQGVGKGTAASGTITFSTAAPVNQDSVTVNGVQIFFGASGSGDTVAIGASVNASATNLANFINSSKINALKDVSASVNAGVVTITAKQTGTIGNAITISTNATTPANLVASGATLTGGVDGDLEANATITSSTVRFGSSDVVGDSIITALSTTAVAKASQTITLSGQATGATSATINGVAFTFGTGAGLVGVGTSAATAATNLAQAINESTNPLLDKVIATVNAGVVTVRYTENGTAGNAITTTAAGVATAGAATLTGGAGSGIQVNNIVNNKDFIGTVGGFKATYVGTDKVNLEVTIGDQRYTATVDDTTPSVNTQVRLYSDKSGADGSGFFDIYLASGQGESVAGQVDADTFAARINKAFSTVTFYQQRDASESSYVAAGAFYTGTTQTGSLSGSSVDYKFNNYTNSAIADIKVEAPTAGSTDGKISITLANGEVFQTAAGLGSALNDASNTTLTSTTNPNNTIIFTTGTINLSGSGQAIQFTNDSQAKVFEAALKDAFGLGTGQGGINFQVGLQATSTIKVAIQGVSTNNLYKDSSGVLQSLDISTAEGAQAASAVLDQAISKVTSVRASVGAYQSRFDFASANLETGIQNTDAARAKFLDADISEESTKFAQSQVLLQASISVLAQANLLPQNLLKLIG